MGNEENIEITHAIVEIVSEYMLRNRYNMQDNPEYLRMLDVICSTLGFVGYNGYMEYLEQCLMNREDISN
jgi:hypothetical protein